MDIPWWVILTAVWMGAGLVLALFLGAAASLGGRNDPRLRRSLREESAEEAANLAPGGAERTSRAQAR